MSAVLKGWSDFISVVTVQGPWWSDVASYVKGWSYVLIIHTKLAYCYNKQV